MAEDDPKAGRNRYRITGPDGVAHYVWAENADQAQQDYNTAMTEQRIAKNVKTGEDTPFWAKPFLAASDVSRGMLYGATAGQLNKYSDPMAQEANQAAFDRLGNILTPVTKGLGAVATLPSLVPKAVTAVGGGPLMRWLVGSGTAAGEQGTYGALEANAEGRPEGQGAITGAAGGFGGQTVATGLGKAFNYAVDKATGALNVPGREIPNLASVAPTRRNLVDNAATLADIEGRGSTTATAQAQQDKFESLLKLPKSTFTKTQREAIQNVVNPDIGTRAGEIAGKLTDPLSMIGAGGLAGIGTAAGIGAGTIPGILAATAAGALGQGAKADAAKATQSAVDDVRRLVWGQKRYQPTLDEESLRPLGQVLGYPGYKMLDYWTGD